MSTNTEFEAEHIRLARSRRIRLRWLVAAILAVVVGLSFMAYKVSVHLLAASWLWSNHINVDWQIDRETWKCGGVTSVKAVINYSFFTNSGNRTELRCLNQLHRVESLDLSQVMGMTDAEVEVIGELTDATFLSFDQTGSRVQYQVDPKQLTDVTLARVANLTRLKELYLGGHKFTDAGMSHLTGLTELEALDLTGNPITDAGLDSLKKLTRLKNLTLIRTKITAAGLKSLEAALPNTNIASDFTSVLAP